jgi:tetratricopeptide (TPR) repeat protein
MLARGVVLVLAIATAVAPGSAPAVASDAVETALRQGAEALRAGDAATAAAAYERAVGLDPGRAEAWSALGRARARLKEWDAAIEAYRRALALEPTAPTYNNLANVHFRRGDYGAAVEVYGKALELDPDYLLALFHHGWCLRQLGRQEEAERSFDRCLRIEPHDDLGRKTRVDCMFGRGSMRHRAGDYAESARMMEQVVAVHPGHPEARYYLGMAYRELGRTEDARAQLAIHAQIMRAHRDQPWIERAGDP